MTPTLADTPWPRIPGGSSVLIPIGSLEQHGPHLPLDTDTVIATAVAERAGDRLNADAAAGGPWLVAPAIGYSASGEHQDFAGTSSIGTDALGTMLVELVRSMSNWAGRVVFVNGHGGNTQALNSAVGHLTREGRDVQWVACECESPRDSHAGFTETSLMLHLAPERVRLEAAEAGNTAPLSQILTTLIDSGVAAVSPNGVLGDPGGADAETGARVLDDMVAAVVERITQRSLQPQ